MDIGIAFLTGSAGLTPPELGRAAEERGFESLFYAGPGTEDRVLSFGDGWFPQYGWLADAGELSRRAALLRQRAADRGRGPVPVTVFGVPPDRALVDQLAAAGADRCLLVLHDATADESLAALDEWAALIPS